MGEIRSKIHKYGDPNESEWPSRFGTGEKGRFTFGEVYKPKIYGEAPQAIFDSMPKTYHEGAGRYIESRKEWNLADKEHNTLTFGSMEESRRNIKKGANAEKKAYKQMNRKASESAFQMNKENPAKVKEIVKKQTETQEKIGKQENLGSLIDTGAKEYVRRK